MSDLCNDQGRAFEYICLLKLDEEIRKFRPATIIQNSSYYAAQHAWNSVSQIMQSKLTKGAEAMISAVFEMEPLIIENAQDTLELFIQPDAAGKAGDVRDIIVKRSNIQWEIGFSIKHNHFAVKHSRLSYKLDFGNKWYGIPCTNEYWNAVTPVFNYLKDENRKGTLFDNLPNKSNNVYVPILQAFIDEINRQNHTHPDFPIRMVEYLLSKYDFYKVVSIDRDQMTYIQPFNVHGELNKPSRQSQPTIIVPQTALPSRLVTMKFVPGHDNTVELYFDKGWSFSFRIHNAEKEVVPTLKFDIQLIGMPVSIMTINCIWR